MICLLLFKLKVKFIDVCRQYEIVRIYPWEKDFYDYAFESINQAIESFDWWWTKDLHVTYVWIAGFPERLNFYDYASQIHVQYWYNTSFWSFKRGSIALRLSSSWFIEPQVKLVYDGILLWQVYLGFIMYSSIHVSCFFG